MGENEVNTMEQSTMSKQDEFAMLSDVALIQAHAASHYWMDKDLGENQVNHHLMCYELTKRQMSHQHTPGDGWDYEVQLSVLAKADIAELLKKDVGNDEIAAALQEAMDQGYAFVDVLTMLSLQGYTFAIIPVGEPVEPDLVGADTNCPACSDACSCTDGCDCWSGCTCTDCVKVAKAGLFICPDCADGCACSKADVCSCPDACQCIGCPDVKKSIVDRFIASINKAIFGESKKHPEAHTSIQKSIAPSQDCDVIKAVAEKRFTLSPMYIPDWLDAHAEWTDAVELQEAVWDYVKSNDRRIRLQHDTSVIAGEWLEIMTMPYEITLPMFKADGSQYDVTYPPGTVMMGVQWTPEAYALIKADKIRGLSIGGKALRIIEDVPTAAKKSTEISGADLSSLLAEAVKAAQPTPQEQTFKIIMPEANASKSKRVERDAQGNITRIVEE